MKKKIAIIFSGQMRENSLGSSNDSTILDSYNKYFFNNLFKESYDYDVYFSVDQINIEKTTEYFGLNLKNINLTEKSYYMNKIDNVIDYDYFHQKYLNRDFKGCETHSHEIYQYYRMYCGYKMAKYEDNYDIYIRIRPDSRIMQDINILLNEIEKGTKIICEHEQLCILTNEMEEMFNLIDNYGNYDSIISNPKENIKRYKHLQRYELPSDGTFNTEKIMMFCPEKQFMDHVFYILNKNNISEHLFLGLVYPSFNLLYRGNNHYAYYSEYLGQYNNVNNFVPFSSI
jgi:hypothetical protein